MFSYVNRKNVTYYLHLRRTSTGNAGYVMTRSSADALENVPPGMEIVENVNAQVSARMRRKRIITAVEESLVRTALERLELTDYRVEIKHRTIVIYEPHFNSDEVMRRHDELLKSDALVSMAFLQARAAVGGQSVEEYLAQKRQETLTALQRGQMYEPVLQFTLSIPRDRSFIVQRMGYSGAGGWRFVARVSLQEAIRAYLPTLGKPSFFEM